MEFPHPSMRIREDLFGMSALRSSAKSVYDLNQSKDALCPSLPQFFQWLSVYYDGESTDSE